MKSNKGISDETTFFVSILWCFDDAQFAPEGAGLRYRLRDYALYGGRISSECSLRAGLPDDDPSHYALAQQAAVWNLYLRRYAR
jgi:hypothetical protein